MTDDILQVSPTRSENIILKQKLALAKKGHSLLKKKQDVLIAEFFKIVKEYKQFKQDILSKIRGAYDALSLDIAYTGIFTSRAVSFASKECFDIDYFEKNVMGVKLPQMSANRKEMNKEIHFENSPLLNDAKDQFKDLFEDLVKLSSLEQTLFALADEIKKVKRRVNSLEHIQIPKIENTRKYVRFVLEEQERENFARLKSIKSKISNNG